MQPFRRKIDSPRRPFIAGQGGKRLICASEVRGTIIMLRSAFLTLLAAAGLAVAATPAAAQITRIDPNSADQ